MYFIYSIRTKHTSEKVKEKGPRFSPLVYVTKLRVDLIAPKFPDEVI